LFASNSHGFHTQNRTRKKKKKSGTQKKKLKKEQLKGKSFAVGCCVGCRAML
jgi:hypothetical protein